MTILDGVAAPLERTGKTSGAARYLTSVAGFRLQVFALDFVLLTMACIVSPVVLGFANPTNFPTPLLLSLVFAGLWLAALAIAGAYRTEIVTTGRSALWALRGTVGLLAIVAIVSYLGAATPYRERVLLNLLVGIPLLLISRLVMLGYLKQLRAAGMAKTRVIAVESAGSLAQSVAADANYSVVGLATVRQGQSHVSIINAVVERVSETGAEAVFVDDPSLLGVDGIRQLAWSLEPSKTQLLIGSDVTQFARGRSHLDEFGGEEVIRIDHSHQSRLAHGVKRAFDIVVSGALLLIAIPIIAITALAIRVESPGSVFFVQPRVGKDGELFPFFKLRSMRPNAHLERADQLGPTDDGILERYRNDARITRVGKFIRRWSIDELPQLVNVFVGHMSLVGPRPVLVEELHDLPTDGERVHLAKPGLTGLWQISGRKEIRWEDRIDLDLEYVDAWSLAMDAKILSKTAGAVVKGSGAY